MANKAVDRRLLFDVAKCDFKLVGASIKDLGLKWFSVNRVTEYTAEELMKRL